MTSAPNRLQSALHRLSKRLPWKQGLVALTLAVVISWLYFTPSGLLGKADAIGYAVCHRIDVRSFHLGVRQIPVCARCTGQYLGAMLGLAYLVIFRPRRTSRPSWMIIAILVAGALAYGVDGLNSYIHLIPGLSRFYLYEPDNTLRLITGTYLGLGISTMIFPAFNQTIWKKWDSRPVFEGFRDFGVLLFLSAVLDLLVLTENPIVLYPLALISAAGVIILLTMIYSMVVVMILGIENHFERISQFLYPLIAGFLVALLQIAALDYFRHLLTGTWGGFPFL
jgi:uncharacterized membrane protein